ncbi:MAG: radical SAM protein [Candidatus Thermoplasmatota archaeon]|nr:radical SAM protein [Candidatus Thermoplasmatota archaeon]
MNIYEIFYSIQGEGNWTGLPNIFIRTAGCNLRCSFCDTTYAYETKREMTIAEIVTEINKHNCNHVCITGGEPLLQNETNELIDALLTKGYKICLETNGSIDIQSIAEKKSVMISLDIKCPSSNMHEKMRFDNISYLNMDDQLKFVIGNKEDYDYAKRIITRYDVICPIFFQPVEGTNPKELAGWILEDGLNVKLGLQIHKVIWGNKRGV